MQVFLNGEPKDIASNLTISALVESLKLDNRKIAIERNLEIIPKSLYAEVTLAHGDRIEVVHVIGGG